MKTSDPKFQQERVVPESRRPDGSIRPARRIRAGYLNDADVTPYRPRIVLVGDQVVSLLCARA